MDLKDTLVYLTMSLPQALNLLEEDHQRRRISVICGIRMRQLWKIGGTAQNISIDDIQYAASYLRFLADNNANPLWTMPPEFDCSEWTLPVADAGTVLVLTKHIKPRTNSSVTYYDLARTIDGGANATPAQLAASLLGGCGAAGGMKGVIVDASDPAYHTPAYIDSGAKPQDLIIKLVRAPGS